MKQITVKGTLFFVDDEDYEKVLPFKWCINDKGYATASLQQGFRGGEITSMHELVFGKRLGYDIHHKDDDAKNNQKKNLEYLTKSQHQMRKKVQSNNASGYKGVAFDRGRGRWLASITFHGEGMFIGRFDTAIEAAKAYDKKALELHGEGVFLNFPKPKITKEYLAALRNTNLW